MIEDAFELLFQSEESMTASYFINAQIKAEDDILPSASESDNWDSPELYMNEGTI